jgi:hypothetical protein
VVNNGKRKPALSDVVDENLALELVDFGQRRIAQGGKDVAFNVVTIRCFGRRRPPWFTQR